MRGEYFYSLIGGVVLGVLVGSLFVADIAYVVWFLLLALVGGLLARRQSPQLAASVPLLLSAVCFGLAIGLLRWDLQPSLHIASYDDQLGEEVTLAGTVVREVEQRERTSHVYIDTEVARVLVFAERFTAVQYGDEVLVSGVLDQPDSFTTELGRTFNYPGYLAARGVGYTMRYAAVDVMKSDQGNPVIATLLSFKERFLYSLQQSIPEPQAGLAAGILLGVKQALGAANEAAFRATGLTHIVVLSGYNVMLVVTFFMYVLAFVLPFRFRLLVGLLGITGFALLVGLSATVVRASIMAGLLLLVRMAGGTHNLLRALALAAAVMLLINPYLLLYDVGFQLSFVATLALILAVELVERWFGWLPGTFGLREFAVATATTQLFVTPLLLFQIGEVSLVAILANLMVLPIVPVAMLLSFIAGLAGMVSSMLGLLAGYPAYLALSAMLAIATTLANVPFATVTVPAFHWSWMVVMYLALSVFTWWYLSREERLQSGIDSNTIEEELVGWTIVEEIDETSKTAGAQSAPAESPTFFR